MDPACASVCPGVKKKSAFKATKNVWVIYRASRARKRKKNWEFSVDDEAEGRMIVLPSNGCPLADRPKAGGLHTLCTTRPKARWCT